MLDVSEYIVATLKADVTVTAIVPAKNIYAGPLDVIIEKERQLVMPQINIELVSESVRSVPAVRDIMMQINVWSKNNQMEVEQIYEAVMNALNYQIANNNASHIYWERSSGAVDQYESDRRVYHRSVTFTVWAQQ